MKKVTVRLSDEIVKKLEEISGRYELKDLEETLRFSTCFTIRVLERMEARKNLVR